MKRPKNVVWQSADGRVTSTTVAWPFSDFFQNFPKSLETSKKRCLTVGRRSRDLRPLSRDRSATFFKKNSNCLKRPKNVVWQSADSRVTSDHCRVTVQRLFSKFSQIAWNVQKRCLTVGRRSRDLRPLSRDRSATFFKKFPIAWNVQKRYLTVGRRSRDHRYCRVTVQRLFSKFFQIASNVQERCLTVGRRSRDLRSLSRDSGYFLPCLFRTACNVQKRMLSFSADGRVRTRSFTTFFKICSSKSLETSKTLFDSRNSTFAWLQLYLRNDNNNRDVRGLHRFVAWLFPLFSDFFQKWKRPKTRISLTVSEIFDRKQEPWTRYFFILFYSYSYYLLAVRIHSNGYWFRSLVQVSIPKFWCWRLHISETIWTTETSFAPFGSATIALGHSKNRTRISPTVSEIFFGKTAQNADISLFFSSSYSSYYYSSFRQKQGHVSPPTGMVRSWKFRHHIKARDRTKTISDFGGKIPTRWFPMREISSPL